jgi:hypothetical protein
LSDKSISQWNGSLDESTGCDSFILTSDETIIMRDALHFKEFCRFMRQACSNEPSPSFLMEEWNLLIEDQQEWLSSESRSFLEKSIHR